MTKPDNKNDAAVNTAAFRMATDVKETHRWVCPSGCMHSAWFTFAHTPRLF